jgi:hypothetical protein
MTERGWHRTFDDPIPLLNGGELMRCGQLHREAVGSHRSPPSRR